MIVKNLPRLVPTSPFVQQKPPEIDLRKIQAQPHNMYVVTQEIIHPRIDGAIFSKVEVSPFYRASNASVWMTFNLDRICYVVADFCRYPA